MRGMTLVAALAGAGWEDDALEVARGLPGPTAALWTRSLRSDGLGGLHRRASTCARAAASRRI